MGLVVWQGGWAWCQQMKDSAIHHFIVFKLDRSLIVLLALLAVGIQVNQIYHRQAGLDQGGDGTALCLCMSPLRIAAGRGKRWVSS